MFLRAGLIKLGHDIVQFCGPLLLKLVLENLESDESNGKCAKDMALEP